MNEIKRINKTTAAAMKSLQSSTAVPDHYDKEIFDAKNNEYVYFCNCGRNTNE